MSGFLLAPPENEVQGLGLSEYDMALLSRVVHVLDVGIHLTAESNGTPIEIDRSKDGALAYTIYTRSALSTHLLTDKFFPLRHTGSSMKYILQHLPIPVQGSKLSTPEIFQLCVWRTFAFGKIEHLVEATFDDVAATERDYIPFLAEIIQAWGKGQSRLAVPAYGVLQIIKAHIPSMLALLWDLSEEIAAAQNGKAPLPTFAALHSQMVNKHISAITEYGLISWLLTSDFFEYGLCLPPTTEDLARHIMYSKSSGPTKALSLIAEEVDGVAPADVEELTLVLNSVLDIIQHPPNISPTIARVVAECKVIQGRDLNVIDLEHTLCKIARMYSRDLHSVKKK